MSNTNAYLYATLFMSMLETDSKNCLEIYKELDLSFNNKLTFLEGTAITIINGATITKNISDNIHLLYNKLIDDYKKDRVAIIESYNKVKGLLNNTTLDDHNKLICEDIAQREFGIYDKRISILYQDAINDFYLLNYAQFMDDIAFDFKVINYLVHPFMEIDNDICADERFLKSLKYIVNLNHDNLDYEMYMKIKVILEYRETLINNGFIGNIKMKNEHKKIVKRLGSKYDK